MSVDEMPDPRVDWSEEPDGLHYYTWCRSRMDKKCAVCGGTIRAGSVYMEHMTAGYDVDLLHRSCNDAHESTLDALKSKGRGIDKGMEKTWNSREWPEDSITFGKEVSRRMWIGMDSDCKAVQVSADDIDEMIGHLRAIRDAIRECTKEGDA
jgi:hypothetical protein